MLPTLNLGILAHVDAGKTSLTERLLHSAGVIDRIGRVDDGNTHTDTLELERRRGITIKSAVTAFTLEGATPVDVNLIDTPGHPDFIAEVERVLEVLDGVILVVSAVEGVQSQTRILMRALQRLQIPVLIFVNKIDRVGARPEELVPEIARRLRIDPVTMGRVCNAGSRQATVLAHRPDDLGARAALVDVLTKNDDHLLAESLTAWDAGTDLPQHRLVDALAAQTARSLVHPVFFGSAVTGAGVEALTNALPTFLPTAVPSGAGEPSAMIFKIDRSAGEKLCYLRVRSGQLTDRAVVRVVAPDGRVRGRSRITGLTEFRDGRRAPTDRVFGGQIATITGPAAARIGDRIGTDDTTATTHHFPPPTLETVVHPLQPDQAGRLRLALDQLGEQDPLINVSQSEERGELSISLYGEVQKQVIEATLAADFDLQVSFSETSVLCVERPIGVGHAVELIKAETNPFLATVGLRVEPRPPGSGVSYRMETVVHGTMPPAFFKAVEETVLECADQALHGWPLVDCEIILTHTGYYPRQSAMHQGFNKAMSSTGSDFRDLTPLVLTAALRSARTVVLEPFERFVLEAPTDTLPSLYATLSLHRAQPEGATQSGDVVTIAGALPSAEVHAFEQRVPPLTHGEGVFDHRFDRYEPVPGVPPERTRTDRNPLNREEYLLRTTRGQGAAAV